MGKNDEEERMGKVIPIRKNIYEQQPLDDSYDARVERAIQWAIDAEFDGFDKAELVNIYANLCFSLRSEKNMLPFSAEQHLLDAEERIILLERSLHDDRK